MLLFIMPTVTPGEHASGGGSGMERVCWVAFTLTATHRSFMRRGEGTREDSIIVFCEQSENDGREKKDYF
jgi:hypothetical protein